jgi:hypothetical protein
VSGQCGDRSACRQIPDSDAIAASGREEFAIRAIGHAARADAVAGQLSLGEFSGGHIPDADRVVMNAGGSEILAIWGKRQVDVVIRHFEIVNDRAGAHAPNQNVPRPTAPILRVFRLQTERT